MRVLEAPVDRGETDVGDFVELLQLGHHQFAQHPRLDLALAGGAQLVLDVADGRFQALDADRTLLQGALHAGAQLVLVERLAAAVLLDQARHDQLGGLEGGEAFAAGQALAAPAHLIALGDQSRVNHFGVMGTAEGTMHGADTGVAEGSRMVAHPRPTEHPQNRPAPARWERREESDVADYAKRDKNHTLRYTSAARIPPLWSSP